jgi:uncharacterized protein with NAD-binding domain and iron-sulfur cluster
MKVVIIGAGIAGLTVAHELVEKGFDVDVYEKDSIAGGMARSTRTHEGVPSEHSWRGYAAFYYNAFEIMSRIPIERKLSDKEPIERSIITYKGQRYDLTDFIPKHPGGTIIKKALVGDGGPLEQVWKDNKVEWHLKNPYVMKILEKYKIGGEEEKKPDVLDNLAKSGIDFKLLNGDGSIAFFDYPYLSYLFVKGAIVNKRKTHDTKLIDVMWPLQKGTKNYLLDYLSGPGFGFDKNTISTHHYFGFLFQQLYAGNNSWQVMNQPTSEAWIDPWVKYLKTKGVRFHFNSHVDDVMSIPSDEYVLAVSPPIKQPNDQISFRLGFNKKISFEKKNEAFVLLESPYNITFYAQDEHWSDDVDFGPLESLWSGTIIQGREAVKLKPKELLAEVKRQLLNSEYIRDLIKEDDIVYEEIFEDWYWDPKIKRLVSRNPKWVNQVGEVRPDNETSIPNVWIAGAHTKTSIDVWSMESAVESGKRASNLILKKYKLKPCVLMSHDVKIGKIDDPFYDAGLPHILDCFLIVLILYILLKTTRVIK